MDRCATGGLTNMPHHHQVINYEIMCNLRCVDESHQLQTQSGATRVIKVHIKSDTQSDTRE